MLRATNTGITAGIDHHGKILERLPQFVTGSLDVEVQPFTGLTPYARWGEIPTLLLVVLLGMWARYGLKLTRRGDQSPSD